MPKPKKRKTTHHSHAQNSASGDLSHAEIWDDSALLRSWNDALAEYDFYHSIHAKGEDVEEVLRRAEMEANNDQTYLEREDGERKGEVRIGEDEDEDEGEIVEDGELDEDQGEIELESKARVTGVPETASEAATEARPQIEATSGGIVIDDAKVTTDALTSDQLLENIKMSYYWAGYYSGLYDAQRQAQPKQ